MKRKYITLLFSAAFLMLVVACGGTAEPEVDIDATVEAPALSVPTATPTPTAPPTPTQILPTRTPLPTSTLTQCTLTGGEIVQEGWSGEDTGHNSCNQCRCMDAGLACTKMACPSLNLPSTPTQVPSMAMPIPTATPQAAATPRQAPPTLIPTKTVSTLAATEWRNIGPTIDGELLRVRKIETSQQDGEVVVYVTTDTPGRILKWSEATQDWTDLGAQLPAFVWALALAIDPTDPQVIYVGLGGGDKDGYVAKSTDGGDIWALYPAGHVAGEWIDGSNSQTVFAIGNQDPRVVYSGTRMGLLKSLDGGESWQLLDKGIVSRDFSVWSIAIDPQDNSIVFVGGEDMNPRFLDSAHCARLFYSQDAGAIWAELTRPPPAGAIGCGRGNVLPGPKKEGCPFFDAATRPPEDQLPRGCKGTLMHHPWAIEFDPLDSQTIYVGTEGMGLMRSQDGGQHWDSPGFSYFNRRSDGNISHIAFYPMNPTRLFITLSNFDENIERPTGVFETRDGGHTWQEMGSLPPDVPDDFGFSPDGSLLYVQTYWAPRPDAISGQSTAGGVWRLELVPGEMNSN